MDRELQPRKSKKTVVDSDSDLDSTIEILALPQPRVSPELQLTGFLAFLLILMSTDSCFCIFTTVVLLYAYLLPGISEFSEIETLK